MSNNKAVRVSGGMGFLSWLQLAFIVLKLTGFIDWSWWYVLLPTLIPAGIFAVIFVGALVVRFVVVPFLEWRLEKMYQTNKSKRK